MNLRFFTPRLPPPLVLYCPFPKVLEKGRPRAPRTLIRTMKSSVPSFLQRYATQYTHHHKHRLALGSSSISTPARPSLVSLSPFKQIEAPLGALLKTDLRESRTTRPWSPVRELPQHGQEGHHRWPTWRRLLSDFQGTLFSHEPSDAPLVEATQHIPILGLAVTGVEQHRH